MFSKKKRIIWLAIIIIVIVIVGLSFFSSKNKSKAEYVTAIVEKGMLIQSVSATGKIESTTETNLNFQTSGNVSKIYVKAGEEVKSGQLLASLQSGQAESQVTQARAQVVQAQADLASIQAGASKEDVAVTETKVTQAEVDLAAKQDYLAQLQSERDQKILSLKEQTINKGSEVTFIIRKSLDDLDVFLSKADYETNFNIHIFSFSTAKSSYATALIELQSLESVASDYSVASSIDELVLYLNKMDTALNLTSQALASGFDLLAVSDYDNYLTQTNIDTYKSTVSTDKTSIASAIIAGQSLKSDLQDKNLYYENSIQTAQSDIQKATTSLDVAKAELALKKAGPRDFDISLYQAKVIQAQASLQKALADLENYRLRAPIDGLISKVNFEVGEFAASSQVVMTLIGESNLQIEVDVPESDIAKIKVGDIASITLDAFSDDIIFDGHITFIDPAETIINDVVYYKVKTVFDHQEEGVKSGMTANVVVTTASRDNTLFIPSRAVIEQDGNRYVRVLNGSQIEEITVITGLRGDEGMIEILEGLEEGQTIITYIKNK